MVFVTGDMHGDETRVTPRALKMLGDGDTLIVCGDFGFVWDGGAQEKKQLAAMGSRRYNICFLDGTHENYDLLGTYRETVWQGGRVHRISGNLFHLERGQLFRIDGLTVFTFGGGESPDRDMRAEHETWWREELPSPTEMAEGAEHIDEAGLRVDVVLTHEPPSLVKSSMLLRSGQADRITKLNGYLEELNRLCDFQRWYFGSMHEDRVITPKHISVFRDIIPLTDL